MSEVKQLRDYQVDERMDIFVLLKEVDPRVTQQGKRYLAVSVADRSMEIRGMKWDATQEEADTLQAGMVIFMTAVRQVYQDKPQLKILSIRPTRVGEPQNPSDFMNAAPMKANEMEKEVSALIFQITNATWQRIVRHLLSK